MTESHLQEAGSCPSPRYIGFKIGCMNVCDINAGKLEDLMTECNEWGLDVCFTETQMKELIEINDNE